ncbi:MAG: (Na+)-NQR maturation NqrM [Gammaproteobacteria bacterium]
MNGRRIEGSCGGLNRIPGADSDCGGLCRRPCEKRRARLGLSDGAG